MVALLLTTLSSATAMAEDWKVFDLKGKVKSVTYNDYTCPFLGVAPYSDNGDVVTFDDSGRVIVPEDGNIIRDKNGVAINIQFYICEGEIDDWMDQKLKYDANGRLQKIDSGGYECQHYIELVYDPQGYVAKRIEIEEAEGDVYLKITTYEYISFDAEDNWTMRKAKTECDWADPETTIETRKIEYYESLEDNLGNFYDFSLDDEIIYEQVDEQDDEQDDKQDDEQDDKQHDKKHDAYDVYYMF